MNEPRKNGPRRFMVAVVFQPVDPETGEAEALAQPVAETITVEARTALEAGVLVGMQLAGDKRRMLSARSL